VHGANRLGTNSLLDLLVFGKASGDTVIDDLRSGETGSQGPAGWLRRSYDDASEPPQYPDGRCQRQRMRALSCSARCRSTAASSASRTCWSKGVAKIIDIEKAVAHTEIKDKSQVWNTARVEALELDNLIEVAKATMVSAEARKESRGAHVRDDAPDTAANPNGRDDVGWHKHTLWHRDGNQPQLQAGDHEAAVRRNHRAEDAFLLIERQGVQ
jgi:succinate dehydrogenase / fumarate reductase flavoprotein subunit